MSLNDNIRLRYPLAFQKLMCKASLSQNQSHGTALEHRFLNLKNMQSEISFLLTQNPSLFANPIWELHFLVLKIAALTYNFL